MKHLSSKKTMNEKDLDMLSGLSKTEVPAYLYDNIWERYQNQINNKISWLWVQSAAAIFLCIFGIETYLCNKALEPKKENYQALVPMPNNMMYHE